MQLLTAKFYQIASEIDSTNAKIAALQAKLSELQEHQQQLLSVEQAIQSALGQVDTALIMLQHVDASQIDTFRDALAIKFTPNAIGILEPSAPTEPVAAPEPVAPVAPEPENDAIDVEVAPAPEPTEPTEPEPTSEDIEQQLNKWSLPSLRSLAKSKGLDSRGTKTNLARRLKTIVTNADLRAVS